MIERVAFWIALLAVWSACGLFVASALTDLRNRRIPNVIPLLLLGFFSVYAAAGGIRPTGSPWSHLAVGAVLLATGIALYATGKFGGGDAKLMAAAGLWAGPADLSVFLFGLGVCALALSAFAMLPFAPTRRMRSDLPFATAIAPPALVVVIPRALSLQVPNPLS